MSLRWQSTHRAHSLLCFVLVFSLTSVPASLFATSTLAGARQPEAPARPAPNAMGAQANLRASYGALPLSFERNQGQTEGVVRYLARAGGFVLFLTSTEAVMALDNPAARMGNGNREVPERADENDARPPRPVVRMRLAGANPAPLIEAFEELAGRSNYFGGPDPAQWRTDVPTYARVRYERVYPGIDLIFYGTERRLEYDFVVAPGADPALVELAFTGTFGFELSARGDLLLHTTQGDLQQRKPIAYQQANGTRREVAARYIPRGVGGIGFELGDYDRSEPLVIDPVLEYSTYLGGAGFDQGYAIAVDSVGSAYVTGTTAAVDFPTTPGAFQTNYGGGDAFIAKLNPEGTALVYSTYLHSASGNGIAVDAAGNAYVTGEASTAGFPTTLGAFQTSPAGFDAFVTKLDATGSALVYSARFGGSFDDFGRAIALDAGDNAYVTGWTVCRAPTCTFPTVNAFQPKYGGGTNDAFVTKINALGSALVYSTYLGGGQILNGSEDWGQGIAVDSSDSAYVTGYTYAPDFPVTPGAYDVARAGLDAFVTKFAPDGASLVYSTFLGGPGREQGQGIAVDATGNAYVTGLTESSDNPFTPEYDGFPVTPGAFQTTGSFDAFVSKLNPQGSALVYSTYLGGKTGVDRGWAIALDDAGGAYVAGDTTSSDFPSASPVQPAYGGGLSDAFVTRVNAAGSALVYSTFLGGSLFDEGRGIALSVSGEVFATGTTSSDDFPTANPLQGSNGGGLENHDDAFVVKLGAVDAPPSTRPAAPSGLVATAGSSSQINLVWADRSSDEGGFEIQRCQGVGCTTFVPVGRTGANVASYSDTGLPAGTRYGYRVSAFNESGHSGFSAVARATTLAATPAVPAAPSHLTANAARTRIKLAWIDNSAKESGFRIERCAGSGCTAFAQIAVVGKNVRSYSNTGLSRNSAYAYRVRAYNSAGGSGYSDVVRVTTLR